MKFIIPIFLMIIVPNLSHACFGGPAPAPGYGSDLFPQIPGYISEKSKTDSERDEEVWWEMGYLKTAPSGWGEIEQISNKYYSLQIFQGGPGSCGSSSLYIYKKLLLTLITVLILSILLKFFYKKYFKGIEHNRNSNIIKVLIPIVVLLLIIPIWNLISSANLAKKAQTEFQEVEEWQLNHDSYETGKQIQHAIEASIYHGGKYYELFPKTLEELVERDLIESIQLSLIANRPYNYTRDTNGKNYSICFPQTEGERCERSWSRE